MGDTSARIVLASLASMAILAGCRADAVATPRRSAAASASSSASVEARDAAPPEAAEARAARLLGARHGALVALGETRFAAIVVRDAEKRSASVDVAIAEVSDADARVAARIELPTSGLWISPDASDLAVVLATARDADGDGAPDLAFVLGYPTEPACGAASARVEQLFVVGSEGRVRATAQLAYLPGSDQVGKRRASFAWDGRDLVISGEECGAKLLDAGACAPFEERQRFDAVTGVWGRGVLAARVGAFERPCAR